MTSRWVHPSLAWLGIACLAPSGADRRHPHHMDLANRVVVQRIGPELADPESQKFAQFDVVRVENPRRLPLSFEVRYEDERGRRVTLGSFALFPPDRPGRFIVATGGRLRRGGAVVVSMVVLQETRPDDRVHVTLDRISFRKG